MYLFMRKLILAAFCLCFSVGGFSAFAQRTAIGTKFISAEATTSFSGFGGGIDVGMYNSMGLWRVQVSDTFRRLNLQSGSGAEGKFAFMHLEADFSHLWRICANHSRTVNFYGGPGVFLGLETLDPFKKWPSGVVFPYQVRDKFIYGVDAQLEFEWFPFRKASNLAFIVDGRIPVNFASQVSKFNYEVAVGLRINL